MSIIAFNKARLRAATHITVMRNLLQYANTLATLGNSRLTGLLASLAKCIDKEDDDYQLTTGSKYTADIEEADKTRDRAWGIIGNVVRAFAEGYGDTEHTAAAQAILDVINKHKVNVTDQFVQETGMINEFTQRADALSAEFAALNLTAVYANLKEGNAKVNEYIMLRQTERADLAVGALKDDRAATDAAYASFVDYVNALAIIQPSAAIDKFVKEWNSYLNYVRVQILHDGQADGTDADAPADGTQSETTGAGTETPTPPAQGGGNDDNVFDA